MEDNVEQVTQPETELWTLTQVAKFFNVCYMTAWSKYKKGTYKKAQRVIDKKAQRKTPRFDAAIIKSLKG